ncbi:ABC-three component system middle component 5 [Kordiimonas lacus]|uniref:Uncharacterized protein n=1 Tax=Kordiimonas lacus TaxID=637679 RepID=A0A1G7E041_9PROT|nr:ABC-three component system middle component 5 [Kordiimonas lacus]SDE57093.1 hypothetical protein SAMN04488071_3226 [Kordiimonas lacus]
MKHRLWHPFMDPYHCCFRLISSLSVIEGQVMPMDRARFLDLFVLFPGLLYKLSLTHEQKRTLKKIGVAPAATYFATLPDIKILYRRLRSNQRPAISQMIATQVIDVNEFRDDKIKLNLEKLPSEILERAIARVARSPEVFEFLHSDLAVYEFNGPEGLLDRAGIYGGTNVTS